MQGMTKKERQIKIDLFKRELAQLERIRTDCTQCEHGSQRDYCSKYKQVVPAEVWRAGCDEWSHDEVPF